MRNRLDGVSQAPYLNFDDGKRNLNANDASNDWNDRNRFLFVRNSISFSLALTGGSFLFVNREYHQFVVVRQQTGDTISV